eukprot:7181205-Ditylum_brightwellii.AAC.1
MARIMDMPQTSITHSTIMLSSSRVMATSKISKARPEINRMIQDEIKDALQKFCNSIMESSNKNATPFLILRAL